MINANELQIGSIIRCCVTKKRISVQSINDAAGYISGVVPDERTVIGGAYAFFDPVALTPEILLACGFEGSFSNYSFPMEADSGEWLISHDGGESVHLALEFPSQDDEAADSMHHIGTAVRTLHQLQNLFFSISGEELQIQGRIK